MDVEHLLPADAVRPRWTSATALVYLGGSTILVATLTLLGILDADLGDYQPASLVVEALTVAAALVALRRFRAPLLVLPVVLTFWIAAVDLGSLGSWADAGEVLSVLVGLLLIAVAISVDGAGRVPYGLWPHAVGGLALGGGVLALAGSDLAWAFAGLLSLAYVAAAYLLARSSYAVLGVIGILATTTYFTLDGFSLVGALLPFGTGGGSAGGLDAWQVALSFIAVGLVIVVLAFVEDRVAALRRP